MDPVLGYSLLATVVVSLMSLVGILTLSVNRDFLNKILLVLISLSAGTLMGDVFFHLLPEAVADSGFTTELSAWILGGFIIFFILEKFVMWHHHHSIESPDEHEKGDHTHHRSIGIMNLMGDAIHNFLDGMIIVAAFMINPLVGMSTTLAIVLHEIPQEFGDFGVLIHSGYSVRKALLFNFLSAGFLVYRSSK
jgi:zinc and cadmium transporter